MNTNKREYLLSVGEKLFSEYGFKKVSIEDVVEEAGISTGSFYTFFSGKEAFYRTILENLETRGIQEADKIISKFNSPLFQLKALYRFTTLGIRESRILRGVLVGDRRYTFPGLSAGLDENGGLKSHIENIIEDIIRRGTENRIFRTGVFSNPKQLLLAQFEVILHNIEKPTIKELLDDTLKLIERGIKRRIRIRKKSERLDRQLDRSIKKKRGMVKR
jgi:AcrR family transcriptional regulator